MLMLYKIFNIYTMCVKHTHTDTNTMCIRQTSKPDQKIKTCTIYAWMNVLTKSRRNLHLDTNNGIKLNTASFCDFQTHVIVITNDQTNMFFFPIKTSNNN